MPESTTEQDPVSNQGRTTPPAVPSADGSVNGSREGSRSAEGSPEFESSAGSGINTEDGSQGDDTASSASSGAANASATDSSAVGMPVDADQPNAPISGEALLVQEGEIAGDYLEQLLDILDYDGDIDLDVEGGRAIVAIVGADDLDPLVGTRGVTLDALQELTRLTVAQQTGVRTRLMLDVGGYRAGRRTELSELAATSVTRVIDSGETVRMTAMNAFERKIVHDVVTAAAGVRSESEGEDPDRRVVILPDR